MDRESTSNGTREPRFACDAMLGGLARWLWGAGYDATWAHGLSDDDVVRIARREGRVLLTADRGILERSLVRKGIIRAILIPRGLSRGEQLEFVFGELGVGPLDEPRCMACGGGLDEERKEDVKDEVPPRSWARCDRFWRCTSCGKLFWRGTHWTRIRRELDRRLEHAKGKGTNRSTPSE